MKCLHCLYPVYKFEESEKQYTISPDSLVGKLVIGFKIQEKTKKLGNQVYF